MVDVPVRTPDGVILGRIGDLTVRVGDHPGPVLVTQLLVVRRGAPDQLVPWSAVRDFRHTGVVLESGAGTDIDAVDNILSADERRLKRDVLDVKIMDVTGQRIARVADVVLGGVAGGGIELVGVDVGFGAVLRRLGLPRLARPYRADVVAWTDMHLTQGRGHSVQLATPRTAVHLLGPRELAVLLTHLDTESATEILRGKRPEFAAAVVRHSHSAVGERMLRAMPTGTVEQIVTAMPGNHAAQWRHRLSHTGALRGRRFLRSRVWPRRRLDRGALG